MGIIDPLLTFSSVVRKLLYFTAAMVFLPLVTFFTVQYVFNANSIVSGGSAAAAANAVLIAYIVVAFSEDTSEEISEKPEAKKDI